MEIDKLVKELRRAKAILKKNKAVIITIALLLSDVKLYHKFIVIKTVWYWCKGRPTEWDRVATTQMNLKHYEKVRHQKLYIV